MCSTPGCCVVSVLNESYSGVDGLWDVTGVKIEENGGKDGALGDTCRRGEGVGGLVVDADFVSTI